MTTTTPIKREVSESCLDFLLLEMINTLARSTTSNNGNHNGSDDIVNLKLEKIGFHVGQKLVERVIKERAGFPDTLEVIRWLCTEFWNILFKRQIDQLKTNNKGVYVMYDSKFRWLLRISGNSSSAVKLVAERYLYFCCGIIRGALYNLGINSVVTAELSTLPSCSFTIKEIPWKPLQ